MNIPSRERELGGDAEGDALIEVIGLYLSEPDELDPDPDPDWILDPPDAESAARIETTESSQLLTVSGRIGAAAASAC
jgi:hypothetical protein